MIYTKQIGNKSVEIDLTWDSEYSQYFHFYTALTHDNFQFSCSLGKACFIFAVYTVAVEEGKFKNIEESCGGNCEGCACK